MKKIYNSPTIEFYKIGLANIIATSGDPGNIELNDGVEVEAGSSLSNQFQGGFVWEDEK